MKTDQWFHALFQALPDLICPLLDAAGAAGWRPREWCNSPGTPTPA